MRQPIKTVRVLNQSSILETAEIGEKSRALYITGGVEEIGQSSSFLIGIAEGAYEGSVCREMVERD